MAASSPMSPPDWMPIEELRTWCEQWQVVELWLFGSALEGSLGPESDVDFLYVHADRAQWSLFDHMDMREELEGLLGRPVDLVSRRAIADSQNQFRRRAILDTARLLDVA